MNEFPVYTLSKASDAYKSVLADISNGFSEPIHPELFSLYNNNVSKALQSVFNVNDTKSQFFQNATQLEANATVFAAHKANYATDVMLKSFKADPENFEKNSSKIFKQFNRWQATEYNTCVNRARTAKQWGQFQKEAHLYPNMEWLITRSADPRELHLTFVGTILPMNDPFWDENQPGNLYNCKCDWKTTDSEPTNTPESVKPSAGLEGNPAKTNEIFTGKHPYYKRASSTEDAIATATEFLKPGQIEKMTTWVTANIKEVSNVDEVGSIFFTKEGIQNSITADHSAWFQKNFMMFEIKKLLENSKALEHGKMKAFRLKTKKASAFLIAKEAQGKWMLHNIVEEL